MDQTGCTVPSNVVLHQRGGQCTECGDLYAAHLANTDAKETGQANRAMQQVAWDRYQRDHNELHINPTSGAECAPNCPGAGDGPVGEWSPEAAEELRARRLVRREQHDPNSSYTDALAHAESDERPVYAYVCEGEISTGTLAQYARAVEEAYYGGLDVPDRVTMLTEDGGTVFGTLYQVASVHTGDSSDADGYLDFRYVRLFIRDEHGKITDAADYKIDLRA